MFSSTRFAGLNRINLGVNAMIAAAVIVLGASSVAQVQHHMQPKIMPHMHRPPVHMQNLHRPSVHMPNMHTPHHAMPTQQKKPHVAEPGKGPAKNAGKTATAGSTPRTIAGKTPASTAGKKPTPSGAMARAGKMPTGNAAANALQPPMGGMDEMNDDDMPFANRLMRQLRGDGGAGREQRNMPEMDERLLRELLEALLAGLDQ